MCEKYLYGAEVQGIQSFIYSTNELKEIVGASELVEEVCTTAFKELLGEEGFKEEQVLVMAAGKIRYLFTNTELCAKVVKNFPRKVIEMAPGITFSQAVVKYNEDDYAATSQQLEDRLREQRNNQFRSPNVGFIGTLRSRKTGLPATEIVDGEYCDAASVQKLAMMGHGKNSVTNKKLNNKLFGKDSNKVGIYDISQIPTDNNWIAIIHADGNGLGQVVQKIGNDSETMKKFSKYLDEATQTAAQRAYENLQIKTPTGFQEPIRPIVLGGDDLTVICSADIALRFVRNFLEEFEKCTGKEGEYDDAFAKGMADILSKNGVFKKGKNYLTACAGIAYIKSSYPFYYGYNLAEDLCSDAKKESKEISGGMENLPPSSVTFHRVQSSFVESFDKIKDKELTANKTSLKFGPYYLDLGHVKSFNGTKDGELNGVIRWSIDELIGKVERINSEGDDKQKLKGNLRDWLTLLGSNPGYAEQRKERITSQLKEQNKSIYAEVEALLNMSVRNPLYDILTLSSIKNITKTEQQDERH
jgi:hypothetical protein